jgi:hypothetical protein
MYKILLLFLLLLSSTAEADLYFELSVEGGGDTLIGSSSGEDINAGGGIKFAGGVQNEVSDTGNILSFSVGYLFDSIDAVNGSAEIDTMTFDAIYTVHRGDHRFGIGGSYHIGPTYEDDIAGFAPLKIEFDDAIGMLFQYGYSVSHNFQVGARLTRMSYELNGSSIDADSFGVFISNGF